jgi:transketolase
MRAWADRSDLDWSDPDLRAVDLIRVPAMDAVVPAGSAYPGTVMSLAQADVPSASARARVSTEAGRTPGWQEYAGGAGASVALAHVGASADFNKSYAESGITAERAAQPARASLATATVAGGLR